MNGFLMVYAAIMMLVFFKVVSYFGQDLKQTKQEIVTEIREMRKELHQKNGGSE